MVPKRKRTLDEEGRVFNEEWGLQYFVVLNKDKMCCLLCDAIISCMKKYNAKLHYETHEKHKVFQLEGEERKVAFQKLKNQKERQQQMFKKISCQKNDAIEATYRVALLLGKRGKPFSDVDIIKESIIEVVSCIHPENISKYKELPLSRRTITTRQHELASNLKQQLNSIIQKEVFYSIAIDESIDNTDSAQVLVFIRAITEDFYCFEELLCLCTMKDRTRGIDILNAFKEKCNEAKLSFSNLVSVCTDGAPAMKGVREGFIGLLKKELPDPESLIVFHCILHQQNLAAKSTTIGDTFNKVLEIVHFIRINSTRHRQFRELLINDDETEIVDMPFYCQVRWLSRGNILSKIFNLKQQIVSFYEKQKKHCYLSDFNFIRNAAFLCDLMSKQNELNIFLQGKSKCIYDMWSKIQAFRKKLEFLKNTLAKFELPEVEEHFPQLAKVLKEHAPPNESFEEFISVLDSLIQNYNDRFKDFEKHENTLKLAFMPHLVDIPSAPANLQMELIELSEDNIMKSLFNSKNDPLKIWKNTTDYPRLRHHAHKVLSCFSTTYCCESAFSYMTQIKTKLRTQLSDAHLEDQLRLRTTMLEPNIELLVKNKQYQKSH